MERKNYTIIIYSVIGAVIVFFIAFRWVNISVQRQMEMQMFREAETAKVEELKKTRKEELQEEKKIVDAHALTPQTIKVQKQSVLLENQRYWDLNTRAVLEQTDVIERLEEAEAFKGDQMTPEQFRRQIQQLDRRISEYEQKVHHDPGDDFAHQKLRSLYMLKATVSAMEETVTKGN